jgi:chromosome segregation ATPase
VKVVDPIEKLAEELSDTRAALTALTASYSAQALDLAEVTEDAQRFRNALHAYESQVFDVIAGLNRMMTMTSEESQFRSRLGLLVFYLETAIKGAAYHVPPEQEKSDE